MRTLKTQSKDKHTLKNRLNDSGCITLISGEDRNSIGRISSAGILGHMYYSGCHA